MAATSSWSKMFGGWTHISGRAVATSEDDFKPAAAPKSRLSCVLSQPELVSDGTEISYSE